MVECWANYSTQRPWRGQLRGWEIHEEQILANLTEYIQLQLTSDRVLWNKGETVYTPSLGYKLLEDQQATTSSWSTIWKHKVPPKIKIFLCHAIHKALPILDHLYRKKICPTTCVNGVWMELRMSTTYYGCVLWPNHVGKY